MNVTLKLDTEDKAEAAAIEMIRTSCPDEFPDKATFVGGPNRAESILHAINGILKVRQGIS